MNEFTKKNKSYGNSKCWELQFPPNTTEKEAETFIDEVLKVENFIKTKKDQYYVKFSERKNIRSKRFFIFKDYILPFRKIKSSNYEQKEIKHVTIRSQIIKIIKSKQIKEQDITANPFIIKYIPAIRSTLTMLEDNITNTTAPQSVNFVNQTVLLSNKQKHFYIFGKPNTGKTTYWKSKISEYNIGPKNNDWRYFKDNILWIIFDEWTIRAAETIGIEYLNELMDGPCLLNTKGSTKQIKQPHIILFCSNFPPEETIPPNLLGAFLTRVNQVNFDTFDTT